MTYSLDEENREVVFLVQACLTQISQNFLYIALTVQDPLLLTFALETDSDSDREAIEDIQAEFYAMHDDDPDIQVEVRVGLESAPPPSDARLIWVRKREWHAE